MECELQHVESFAMDPNIPHAMPQRLTGVIVVSVSLFFLSFSPCAVAVGLLTGVIQIEFLSSSRGDVTDTMGFYN